ncbi:hypothetical protein [Oceanobacillus senegalensis]|uniref:hypothetical protein n=1 Tax=Oceanobacillus senegalensis TaxID=1936063 RepID=UPI000A30D838|nr:hypothetical protein [Oceanobacillus senegalensis]
MAVASNLLSILVLVSSFLIGIIVFYMMSSLTKDEKWIHIKEIVSQLIDIVIFIWIGKILLNLFTFVNDPVAVLAYPSSKDAFYIAIVLFTILLYYKNRERKSI